MNNYIFNTCYKLKNDKDRILLTNTKDFAKGQIVYFIHPMHAALLSFFDGSKSYQETINEICEYFEINKDNAENLISKIKENKEVVHYFYDNNYFSLPEDILIPNNNNLHRTDLDRDKYIIDGKLNFKRRRLGIPINLLICINLRCVTDCIYCYANKKAIYTSLKPEKWVSLIYEAKRIGIENVDVTGGEFFLNPNWQKIAKAIVDCDYEPEISTKVPLSYLTIDKIVEVGLKSIQFSLDTLDPYLAKRSLRVEDNYVANLLDTIRYCDQKGLEIVIKPSLNKETCTVENVNCIIDFAKTLKNMKRCVFTIIGYSCFKSEQNYLNIRPSQEQANKVAKLVSIRANEMACPMYNDNQLYLKKDMQNYSKFKDRAVCTANVDGLVVLPDGQVTVCEELYWNKNFLLGDIKVNTIEEIWSSSKALQLWNISQEEYPHDSACKTCQDFNGCHQGKGVCWKIILAAYGQNNIFEPDPRCPKAPDIKYHFVGD